MKTAILMSNICIALLLAVVGCNSSQSHLWKVHDMARPAPKVVTPGESSSDVPSDAIVLFDGTDLSQWTKGDGQPAKWKVQNGYMEAVKRAGSISTKRSFGDCQLHIEWAAPAIVEKDGQGRGNSGVFLMDKYEVQVLDSYGNTTYADGQAGSIYGQNPPMVNVCREPGKWQSYDIIFRRPIFKGEKLVTPATITVLQNGVLIQDHWIIEGPTAHKSRTNYTAHADKLPIMLQDHGNPVRYRNIWIRELPEKE